MPSLGINTSFNRVRPLIDSDVSAFATESGATDLTGLNNLVKYLKSQSLYSNFVIYPMKSAQNAGSGSTVYSLGGLTTNDMTLVSSPSWGATGITFDGVADYGSISDFLATDTLTIFNRVAIDPAPPSAAITRLYGHGDASLNSASLGLSYAGNAAGDPFRLFRSANGQSGLGLQAEFYDTTDEVQTTSDQCLVNQWVSGGGRSMWQDKTSLGLTLFSGSAQTEAFNSSAAFIYSALFDNGALLQPSAQLGIAPAFLTGSVTTTQRETITDLINAL